MSRLSLNWHHIDQERVEHRASRPHSASPRPFLRWAGSKRHLLPQLAAALPDRFRVYWEPFMGSASLFFLLRPERAVLSDSCADLVATFQAVRDDPGQVLAYLRMWRPDPTFFYQIRRERSTGRFRRAAEFIYLNKTCWNGLYRVNSQGEFNVPYGRPKTQHLIDAANLRACAKSLALPGVKLDSIDFEEALHPVKAGDLVFLDPPYVTRHNNNGFVDYNEKLFSWKDQVRLAKLAGLLVDRGAHVVVTNAAHAEVISLYPGFRYVKVDRTSSLAADILRRGPVREGILVGSRTRSAIASARESHASG